ncbi:MAG: hypothetical protein ACT4N2_09785 [Hyphomicrobium sp.]
MKKTITSALAAMTLTAGLFAGQAQAHTQLRFPYKSAPYAVPHTHPKSEFKVRSQSDCPRTVIIRGSGKSQTNLFCPVL